MSHVDDYWKDRAFLSRGDLQGQQPENVALEVQSDTFMMSHADVCSEGIDFSDLHKYLNSVPHGDQDQQPENAPFEAQSGMNEPQISPGDNQENSSGRKRDRGVTLNFSDAKEKRPRRQSWRRGTDFTSESSTPGEPEKTEELTYAEQITPLTVGKSAKLLIDRINHRLKSARELLHNSGGIRDTIEGLRSRAAEIQGMMKDGGAMKAEFQKVMKVEIQKSMKDMDDTEAKIQEFRKDMHATEAEIQRIKKVITKIPKDGKLTVAAAKQRLINMENEYFKKFLQDLQNARKMYKQILQETNKIDEKMLELPQFFLKNNSMEYSKETPREKVYLSHPSCKIPLKQLSIEGNAATDVGVTVEQDKNGEDLQYKFRDLENQLYSKDNNKVENRDFLGLEQALDHTTGRKVPDNLKLIEFRIENDRGKAAGSAHFSVLVMVCAAIKEMEESDEFSDWETLKKWAATLNQAKELGFRVGFADKLLKMKLLAYFATQLLKASQKKKGLAFS